MRIAFYNIKIHLNKLLDKAKAVQVGNKNNSHRLNTGKRGKCDFKNTAAANPDAWRRLERDNATSSRVCAIC